MKKGYTKNINLLSFGTREERMLLGLCFNFYRHFIALKYNISNFKPVILFKSKDTAENEIDYNNFLQIVENLNKDKIEKLFSIEFNNDKFYFDTVKNCVFGNINTAIDYVKNNFNKDTTVITNSKKDDKINDELNNLEAIDNKIRAIFVVDRLVEGWDVLNLFDIVRLDESQNAGGSDQKVSKTTTQEIQLIGRGVRYCPFSFEDKQKNKQKFDKNENHELRILEEFFFYAFNESRYITDLKNNLINKGYMEEEDKTRVEFKIKPEVFDANNDFNFKIWQNQKKLLSTDKSIEKNIDFIKNKTYNIRYIKGLTESKVDLVNKNITDSGKNDNVGQKDFILNKHILRKAMNCIGVDFSMLKNRLNLKSLDDLVGLCKIRCATDCEITTENELQITIQFAEELKKDINSDFSKYEVLPFILNDLKNIDFNKIKSVKKTEKRDFGSTNWYMLNECYINNLEAECIKDIQENIIKDNENIFLLRNEEVYKIFCPKELEGFCPDFILFYKKAQDLYYQILIEVKGDHLKNQEWKENFLIGLSELKDSFASDNKKYRLIGLPFYKAKQDSNFITILTDM